MFKFKQFEISDQSSAMKIGTDGVLLGAWAFERYSPSHIVDVGSGSGLISLMLAQRFPSAKISAIEIDQFAYLESRKNIDLSPWANRIDTFNCDFKNFISHIPVDAIVSNPPFFDEPFTAPDSQRAMARHQATLSPIALIEFATWHLSDQGILSMIVPAKHEDELIYLATVNRLDCNAVIYVKSNQYRPPFRVLIEFTKGHSSTFKRQTLIIKDKDKNHYTTAYQDLTKDFYLDSTFA